MKYTDNAINIIAAKTFKGIGRAWIVKNLNGNENISTIVSIVNKNSKQDELITLGDFELARDRIVKQIQNLEGHCDGIVAMGDSLFPKYRGNVRESERPIFLFYRGNLDLLNLTNDNVTVIGLLNPDESIRTREQKIVAEIVKRNVTIVSGLALGCDSIAHEQALIGGNTIAILPSPLNNVMPAKNKNLAVEIVRKGGLLVTEYYDDHKSSMDLSSRYKDRDRLQALYCDAIILAASYAQDSAARWRLAGQKLDSGARLAMGFAKDYDIPRAVMYDPKLDLENPMFDLNRELMNQQRDVLTLTPNSLKDLITKVKLKKDRANHQTGLFD